MKVKIFKLIFVLLIAFISPVFANSITEEMGTGGLIYVYSPDVKITKKELFISRYEIRVEYEFFNKSEKDITSIVAFPMPSVTGNPYEQNSIPSPELDNILNFSVVVDGLPITPNLEQKAYALGLDVTNILKKAKVSLLPFAQRTIKDLELLPKKATKGKYSISYLQRRGMVENIPFNNGIKEVERAIPIWTLKSSFWWKMKFRANQTIKISYSYEPSRGSSTFVTFVNEDGTKGLNYDKYKEKYCIDDAFINEVKQDMQKGVNLFETYISYVLVNPQNWYGTIDNFYLNIDKIESVNSISFCADKVKRVGLNIYEINKKDFDPEKDLHILIMRRF